MAVAASLVDEQPFLGYRPRKLAGRVGYWNFEMNRDQMRDWWRRLGIENPKRISVLNLRDYAMPLTAPLVQDWAIKWLKNLDIEYWIFEPWRRVIVGSAKENDNDEITALTSAIDIIKREAGVSDTLTTVHTGRAVAVEGEERSRGATALDDWADVLWSLTKQGDERFFSAVGRDVAVDEFRIGYNAGRLTTSGGSRKEARDEEHIAEVVRVVWAQPRISYKGIEAALRFNKNDKAEAIAGAIERGLISFVKEGKEHLHTITERGKKSLS